MRDQQVSKGAAKSLGEVVEALPSASFKVKLDNGSTIFCYLSGRMRIRRIRVLVGDKVEVELDQYGQKGRIVRRL